MIKEFKVNFTEKEISLIYQKVKDMIKRHKEGESLEYIINNYISK